MAIKDILVHLDNSEAAGDRIEGAIALASREKAHVTGVALALEVNVAPYAGIDIPTGFVEQQDELAIAAARKAVATFEEKAKEAGVDFATRIERTPPEQAANVLGYHARHADLTFMGQPNPDDPDSNFLSSLLDGVMFASGRPVYIVPYIGRRDVNIRKAVVAWDGGKKAARAINDAIPLLQERAEVIVLVINPDSRRDAHGGQPGEAIVEHLKRHGVNARVELHVAKAAPDNLILNFMADSGADLLVMGAYSHSRLRERAFGGVTHTVLQQMVTPVLMSE